MNVLVLVPGLESLHLTPSEARVLLRFTLRAIPKAGTRRERDLLHQRAEALRAVVDPMLAYPLFSDAASIAA